MAFEVRPRSPAPSPLTRRFAVSGTEIFARLWRQIAMLALRGGATAAKFALSLYMARYLGLADLGIYGLLVGAATAVPAILGFGLTDWTTRNLVGLPVAAAMPAVTSRLALTVAVHAVGQPLAWAANAVLGGPIPASLVVPIGLILFLEHLANDAYAALLARNRALLGASLMFMRSGAWPLFVIGWGMLDPRARTLEVVLDGWVAGLAAMWLMIAAFTALHGRWRCIALRPSWLRQALRGGWPFYLNDIATVGNLYVDRFLVSVFLGLELTGVYVFFWSVANVVHNLAVYSLMQPNVPRLVSAAAAPDPAVFRRLQRSLQLECGAWAVLMAIGAAALMPLLLPLIDRPLLQQNLAVFAIVMVATLLRAAADSYNFVLLALHRDQAIAATSLAGVAATAALNLVLIPLAGLDGAACAFLIVSLVLVTARYRLSRAPMQAGAER